jgi:hypothetical protein
VVVGRVVPVVGMVAQPIAGGGDVEDDAPVVALSDTLADEIERRACTCRLESVEDCACIPGAVRAVVVIMGLG